MDVAPVVALAVGAAGLLVVLAGVRPSRRTRANRWIVGCLGAALVVGATFRLATSAATPPPAPLTTAEVTAFVYLRCDVLLQPFSVTPGGGLTPEEQRPFWVAYASALVDLAGELEPLDVEPEVRPAVDELGRALVARADSVEAELRAFSGGTSEQIAEALATGISREGDLDAALDDLDLRVCASY